MAAIGASSTAKRLALAYVLFKVIAAVIALLLFPVLTPILISASRTIDGVTLLAGYHTAYNVVGVLVLLPLMDQFTRFVERILPERTSALTRCLDPAALATPIAAVEAVRRTVARALIAVCRSLDNALQAASRGEAVWSGKDAVSVPAAAGALRQAQIFMSDVSGPPESDDEQQRLTNTLHALEHASRLAEAAGDKAEFTALNGGPDDVRASRLCADAMRSAVVAASEVAARNVGGDHVTPIEARSVGRELPGAETFDLSSASTEEALMRLEHCAKTLDELQRAHRSATLSAVAGGALTGGEAIARVDAVRRLGACAHHAWRSAAHLVGRA
jgi:phosphate:Na+ symporter